MTVKNSIIYFFHYNIQNKCVKINLGMNQRPKNKTKKTYQGKSQSG
jgi:hypothetical protein